MSKVDEYQQRYLAACHAMQSGVRIEMEEPKLGRSQDTDPKHLRVGVNVALVNHGSLVQLLRDKGVITDEEYFKAICDGMEAEVKRYEERLSAHFKTKVTLG